MSFFENLGVETHLPDYGINSKRIYNVINLQGKHGMAALSKTKDLSLEISREILENVM